MKCTINIIIRFQRESRKIFVRNKQSWKLIPDVRDRWAPRRHCVKNSYDSVMEITDEEMPPFSLYNTKTVCVCVCVLYIYFTNFFFAVPSSGYMLLLLTHSVK